MVSILPAERGPWDVIGAAINKNVSQNLPGAVQQGYQRQIGHNAIDRLQQDLSQSGGDISKMLPAIARAYTDNPALERSGIAEHALRQAKVGQAFGGQGAGGTQNPAITSNPSQNTQNNDQQSQIPGTSPLANITETNGIIPTLDTQQDIDSKAKQWAIDLNDPAEYSRALDRLNLQNQEKQKQISKLEDLAAEQGVSRQDMPEFMQLGRNHNYMRDPNKWVQATNKDWGPYKNAKEQLSNAFVPGFFRGLISSPKEREASLKRLEKPIQEILKLNPALEPKIRADLQGEYLSPTEVELAIHPLSNKTNSNLEKLPKGIFPKEEFGEGMEFTSGIPKKKQGPFVSYNEALKKDPRGIEVMNKRLVDFFKKNIDPDTTLLGLRDKIWNEKDYDWRQIADAMQEATTGENAVKLSPNQRAEITQLQTQAPLQSLSDVFSDWKRWMQYIRGNK
jgi:hypothetical protein